MEPCRPKSPSLHNDEAYMSVKFTFVTPHSQLSCSERIELRHNLYKQVRKVPFSCPQYSMCSKMESDLCNSADDTTEANSLDLVRYIAVISCLLFLQVNASIAI